MQEKNNQASEILAQQAVATEVVDWLASIGYTDACVAGGAARDWFLCVNARDIDIFVVDTNGYCWEDVGNGTDIATKIEEKYPTALKELTAEGSANYVANCNGIFRVFEFKHCNFTVQLILCGESITDNPDKKLWYNFPASTSKISWKNGEFEYSSDFKFSVDSKVILFDNNKNNKKNDSYLKKTKKRFKNWPVYLCKKESLKLSKKG